jgi:hypothetical protein
MRILRLQYPRSYLKRPKPLDVVDSDLPDYRKSGAQRWWQTSAGFFANALFLGFWSASGLRSAIPPLLPGSKAVRNTPNSPSILIIEACSQTTPLDVCFEFGGALDHAVDDGFTVALG